MSFEDIVNYHNHIITNIEIYDTDNIDVYCLTNFEYSNFALSSGVFVHNCGMHVVQFECADLNLEKLDGIIRGWVPSGFDIHPGIHDNKFVKQATEVVGSLRCGDKRHAGLDLNYMIRSMGSLGSGNHFIEVDTDKDGRYYLVIHSGSRKLGVDVCEYYQKKAENKMLVSDRAEERNKIVAQLKAEGREKEIKKTLDVLPKLSTKYKDLAYVVGEDFDDYMYDMARCQEFATLNRLAIADAIITHYNNCMKKSPIKVVESWTTIHNYIDHDGMILRKGSVSARKGEKLIIPMNMRDGSLICIGKGNPEWNYSAPHGAGRLMSRGEANRNVDMAEFAQSMAGIYTTSVCEGTRDEAPMVYKPMDSIIEQVKDTVEIVDIIKPIYNYKAH
jgi:RNA-splicing ligase RtcB